MPVGESSKSRANRAVKRQNPLAKLKELPATLREAEAVLSQVAYASELMKFKGVVSPSPPLVHIQRILTLHPM